MRSAGNRSRSFARRLFRLALVAAVGACAPGSLDLPNTEQVVVLAAASLTGAFDEIADAFEADNPGTDVVLSFAGSQALAAQILDGAPADVFAAADPQQMARVADAGLVTDGGTIRNIQTFATNALAIAVEPGNPMNVLGLEDLARADLVVVLAAPEVPVGKYAAQALERQGVTVSPASLEDDVKGVMAKVTLGEADAGVVYATDITASDGAAEGVPITPEANVAAHYVVAPLRDAANPGGGAAFVAFLMSGPGQAILRMFGFAPP